MSYKAAWMIMMWFAVKDIAFTIIGAIIAPRIYYAVRRSDQHSIIIKMSYFSILK